MTLVRTIEIAMLTSRLLFAAAIGCQVGIHDALNEVAENAAIDNSVDPVRVGVLDWCRLT